MPIQLDKILSDIADEAVLHPSYDGASKKELDDAWARVGKSNKLSVHEARSIFKVLQKKYEQEKNKRNPSWKLFNLMEQIHQKMDIKEEIKQESEAEPPIEEDEEYEMLEVQEEDEQSAAQPTQPAASAGSASDGESPTKSLRSTGTTGTPEKEEKAAMKTFAKHAVHSGCNNTSTALVEEKKLLNTMAPRSAPTAATAAALQKKGITMKKTAAAATAAGHASLLVRTQGTAQSAGGATTQTKNATLRAGGHLLEVGKTIQLPESIKRKLSEEQPTANQSKKANSSHTASNAGKIAVSFNNSSSSNANATAQHVQPKQEAEEYNAATSIASAATHGINLITIPGNARVDLVNGGSGGGPCSSTAATVASTSTNGLSPRIEDVDFRNDIIFDAGPNGLNGGGTALHKMNVNNAAADSMNMGNFDNSLPPTFFKNLCNSSRHEALGLYVANVMNRLQSRSAAKLELGILRAIIDVQSDELEQ